MNPFRVVHEWIGRKLLRKKNVALAATLRKEQTERRVQFEDAVSKLEEQVHQLVGAARGE